MDTPGFKTILCPVDFGELSAHALRHANLLAGCGSAQVIAIYANWFEAPAYFTAGRVEELRKQFREALGEAERSLKAFVDSTLGESGDKVETRVVEALPADGILGLAASTGADLIVMGTHGRSGFSRWMLGSVTERILRESPVPLLTVRAAPRGPVRRILSPIDGTAASRNAFRLAAGLGACFNAEITAVYVHESGSAHSVPDLCTWIPAESRQRCNIRELVRHGDPAEEIVALASEEAFDLLVIGAPHRRFFEGLVLGTTTLRAVRHAPCPVLTVSGPGEVR
ncbi:MAG: universal stress protein [Candidatus Solibacter sp.]|jgi:nucleotide-binding universal stress UspA family protein